MASNKKDLAPYVSNSGFALAAFWIFMFTLIAAGKISGLQNQYGAVNPVVLFPLAGIYLLFFSTFQVEKFSQLRQAYGYVTPIPGFWFLMLLNGAGIGLLAYTMVTGQLNQIFGQASIASVSQPFYNPYTASATAFTLGELFNEYAGIWVFNAIVAVFETTYQVGMFKIAADYIHQNTPLNADRSLISGFLITLGLWGLWHWFAWPVGTSAKILMAVSYGMIFFMSYFIVSAAGLVPGVDRSSISSILLNVVAWSAIGAHLVWNVFVSAGGFGIAPQTIAVAGIALFGLSTAALYGSQRLF